MIRKMVATFPAVFWVSNIMELFERAAYYGLNAVLAIYLTDAVHTGGLGFSEQSVGFLQGLIYALTYIVPILGGALADRYGYRRMLMVAFSLLTAGYFISGHMSAYGAVFASLLIMATGAGLFKPIISGTIARTTTEENSGFGFGVYYWMINLGAFLAPLAVSVLKGFSWKYVFIASALYCALMLIPAVFFYKEPPKPVNTKNLKDVMKGMSLVLGDARFMLMIFIYSCFWILYFQNFGSILWYLRDFIDTTPVDRLFASAGIPFRFGPEHVTVINAGTIILLQVLISRLVRNIKPLPTMVLGVFSGVLGFTIIALAGSIWVIILGLAVFTLGEMTAHPKYYSYVGLVAPAETKAVYMGYAFLYGVIGSLLGSNIGGSLYEMMMKPLIGQPGAEASARLFWMIFAGMGIVATAGLWLFHRFLSADTDANHRRSRYIVTGVYGALILLGLWFLFSSVFRAEEVVYRTMIQSLIMIVIGVSGLYIILAHHQTPNIH